MARYRINWDDPFYPCIEKCKEGESGHSFSECKKELIEYASEKVEHWRDFAKTTRSLRKEDVT